MVFPVVVPVPCTNGTVVLGAAYVVFVSVAVTSAPTVTTTIETAIVVPMTVVVGRMNGVDVVVECAVSSERTVKYSAQVARSTPCHRNRC